MLTPTEDGVLAHAAIYWGVDTDVGEGPRDGKADRAIPPVGPTATSCPSLLMARAWEPEGEIGTASDCAKDYAGAQWFRLIHLDAMGGSGGRRSIQLSYERN